MTPYNMQMSPAQIKNLTYFIIHSLVGSNPENPKDSQGEKCE